MKKLGISGILALWHNQIVWGYRSMINLGFDIMWVGFKNARILGNMSGLWVTS